MNLLPQLVDNTDAQTGWQQLYIITPVPRDTTRKTYGLTANGHKKCWQKKNNK